ncbi:putative F-box domain-containing protein [Helianthus debilis subsp. tardiflorus]
MAEQTCKSMSLLKLVEERASMKKKLDEQKQKQQLDSVPYLPKDCVSNILIRLPIESLQRSRFVCKPWYSIIKSPTFIRDNLHRAEKVLIFLSPLKRLSRWWDQDSDSGFHFHENPNTFSVESKVFELKSVHGLLQPLVNPTFKRV